MLVFLSVGVLVLRTGGANDRQGVLLDKIAYIALIRKYKGRWLAPLWKGMLPAKNSPNALR